uniref:Uncharacterized protein n=1 Tax=Arundo donax TaxID=35708 RepID=A0A0A8Y0T3_ARUDO
MFLRCHELIFALFIVDGGLEANLQTNSFVLIILVS